MRRLAVLAAAAAAATLAFPAAAPARAKHCALSGSKTLPASGSDVRLYTRGTYRDSRHKKRTRLYGCWRASGRTTRLDDGSGVKLWTRAGRYLAFTTISDRINSDQDDVHAETAIVDDLKSGRTLTKHRFAGDGNDPAEGARVVAVVMRATDGAAAWIGTDDVATDMWELWRSDPQKVGGTKLSNQPDVFGQPLVALTADGSQVQWRENGEARSAPLP
jgi:hypothetical protein